MAIAPILNPTTGPLASTPAAQVAVATEAAALDQANPAEMMMALITNLFSRTELESALTQFAGVSAASAPVTPVAGSIGAGLTFPGLGGGVNHPGFDVGGAGFPGVGTFAGFDAVNPITVGQFDAGFDPITFARFQG